MAFLSGADGGTRTRDLFLTKEVLYLLSYISVSMILTVCDDLRLPAFLPLAGVTKEVLYLLSYISIGVPTVVFIRLCRTPRAGRTSTISAVVLSKATTLLDYIVSAGLCQSKCNCCGGEKSKEANELRLLVVVGLSVVACGIVGV